MKRLIFLLAFLGILCGCSSPETEKQPEGYGIYYAVSGEGRGSAAIECEYHVLPENTDIVPELVGLILSEPESADLQSPIPDGVKLKSWSQMGSELFLDFTEQYGGLDGVRLTVADYCIAMTLCQLENVESVNITVEGRGIPFRHSQSLRAEDVLLPGDGHDISVAFELWFPRNDGSGLGIEHRQQVLQAGRNLQNMVLTEWMNGPGQPGLMTLLPEGVEIITVELKNQVCYIDMSEEFFKGIPSNPNQAEQLVYGLVNTIGSLDSVESVQLLQEGRLPGSYSGLDLSRPLIPIAETGEP